MSIARRQFRVTGIALVVMAFTVFSARAQVLRQFSSSGEANASGKSLLVRVQVELRSVTGDDLIKVGEIDVADDDIVSRLSLQDQPPPPPPPPSIQPKSGSANVKRFRVSERIMRRRLLRQVRPVYPPIARTAHIFGPVVLQATIGKNGAVKNLDLMSGHPLLSQAALDAAKQWRYKPWIVNGEPVEVETEITVNFDLEDQTSPAASTPSASPPSVIGRSDSPGQAAAVTDTMASSEPPAPANTQSHGLDVQLPPSTNSVALTSADRADAVMLSVTRDGQLFLGLDRVDLTTLAGRLKDLLANRIDKTVFLNADARASFRIIESAFNRIRAAGADVCDLLTSVGHLQEHATAMGLEVLLPPPPLPPASAAARRAGPSRTEPAKVLVEPLHAPATVPLGAGAGNPIVVQVLQGSAGVRWKINREDVSDLHELTAHLQSILRTRAEKVVFVKADESLTFRDVVETIDAIYASTADKVAMIIPVSK